MNTEIKIQQLEGEMISHNNTIKSIMDRIAYKNECIEAINKPGRPDKFFLEYGDRVVEIVIEEPDKYAKQLEDLTVKLLKADVDSLQKAIAKQEAEMKPTEKELSELKAIKPKSAKSA